jgi:dephospho-CoA kinase
LCQKRDPEEGWLVLRRSRRGSIGKGVRRKKPIIGLCGGVGAGKSRVAAEFARLGCLVVDSDKLNHEVLLQADVLQVLQSWWGQGVMTAEGKPDRRRIADIIFADADQKRRLEGFLHPLILTRQEAMITAVEDNPAVKAIVIDSPLLIESQLDRQCDSIVFVEADEVRRLERLRRERGWTAEEVTRREGWQTPLVEKRSRATFVVDNDGPVERLRPQVADILQTILAQHS